MYKETKDSNIRGMKLTSGLLRLAGVHDPPEACDIPINVEFDGDYHGGSGVTGNG